MKIEEHRLSKLVNMDSPKDVLEEVNKTLSLIFPQFDFELLSIIFNDVIHLFQGRYPGYKKCDTTYHEVKHTTDTFLSMARIIHGATIKDLSFSKKNVMLALIGALLHDSGYILNEEEEGPGAKYTLVHIGRSIGFLKKYLADKRFSKDDVEYCAAILKCTGLDVKLAEISFKSKENEILGKMLGTGDLLGQMADRTYLKKLPYLYYEFKEANIEGLGSELDFLEQTPKFFEMVKKRFRQELGGVFKYTRDHFRVRWGIDEDLYMSAIENSIKYLKYVLEYHRENYREYLSCYDFMPKVLRA